MSNLNQQDCHTDNIQLILSESPSCNSSAVYINITLGFMQYLMATCSDTPDLSTLT